MISLAYQYQSYVRRIIALSSVVCFISVVLYGMFLLLVVGKAAAQQKYESQARDLEQSLATLETQYLAASNDLTPQKAQSLGLVPVPSSHIAYLTADAPSFSMR